jgi:hypothetical protein
MYTSRYAKAVVTWQQGVSDATGKANDVPALRLLVPCQSRLDDLERDPCLCLVHSFDSLLLDQSSVSLLVDSIRKDLDHS